MRKILLIVAMFFGSTYIGVSQILTFEFAGIAGNELTVSSNSNNANITSSTIIRGSGLTASAYADRFNAKDYSTVSIADAITNNDYMEFSITPNSGYMFSVSSIYFQFMRSLTGPSAMILRSSEDNYTSNLDQEYAIGDNTNQQTFTFTFTQTNIKNTVTYRIYMYAESSNGSGGFGAKAGNDIVVSGTVDPIPVDLMISEVADPGDYPAARFVEIYNGSSFTVNLSGYSMRVYNDGSGVVSNTVSLSGTLASGGFYTLAYDVDAYTTAYSNLPSTTSAFINGDGDDVYQIFDGTSVIDVYGEVGVDGTGTVWDYTGKNSVRTSDAKSSSKGNSNFTPSEWSINPANISDVTPGGFSTGQDASTLPMSLVAFSAEKNVHQILINWTTATEVNNRVFTLLKSFDGVNFESVAMVAGAGNSNQLRNYSYTDVVYIQDIIYYKLKQTDFNGASTLSEIIQVVDNSAAQNISTLYSDNNQLFMNISATHNTTANIQMYSLDGKLVFSEAISVEKGNSKYSLNLPNLPSGLYIVNLVSGNSVITKKIMIQ